MPWPGTGKAAMRRRELKEKAHRASSVYETSAQEVRELEAAFEAARAAGDHKLSGELAMKIQIARMSSVSLMTKALDASIRAKRW